MIGVPRLYGRKARVLIVTGNTGEARSLSQALSHTQRGYEVRILETEAEANARITAWRSGNCADQPDLILLDFDSESMNGAELLRMLKSHEETRKIPVIAMSSAESAADVETAYESSANCVVHKPVNQDERLRMVRAIESFWFGSATLPRTC